MAMWNEARHERPAATNRFRDVLVMAIFSLAALAAAFAVVQYLHAERKEQASSTAPTTRAETVASVAPQQAESARPSVQALLPAIEAGSEAQSALRADLQRVRGELKAAIGRISELEDAVEELQAASARDPQPEPETPATSRAEPRASSNAAPAAPPTRDAVNRASKKAAQVEGEDVGIGEGETVRYLVQSGDRAAKIAKRHCLSLADLQRLNPDIRDLNALGAGQPLSVEDRCVTSPQDRAAAD